MLDLSVSDAAEADGIRAWQHFLTNYARGKWAPDIVPPRPPLSPEHVARLDAPWSEESAVEVTDIPLYTSTSITPDLAREVREFYCDHGYLAPPRDPLEEERETCIYEYDIYSQEQLGNIQAATDLLASIFSNTICTFSLFHNRVQTHFAVVGTDPVQAAIIAPGLRIKSESSLCGHAVLLKGRPLVIPDLSADWRYGRNPWVLGGMKSYVGSTISLELDPTSIDKAAGEKRRIGIGTINIVWVSGLMIPLTAPQERVLAHVTSMLETQLRATWEGHRRTTEARARRAISQFIDEALVGGKTRTMALGGAPAQHPAAADNDPLLVLADSAIERAMAVLPEINYMCILDLRGFQTSASVDSPGRPYSYDTTAKYPLRILASRLVSGGEITIPPSSTIAKFLSGPTRSNAYKRSGHIQHFSGLEDYLPEGTEAHLVEPFFAPTVPLFLAIATSTLPDYAFPATSTNIVRSLGSVLRARAVQNRVVEADAAKTTFLSSISHELRTPMHGVMTGLEMIQKAVSTQAWDELPSLLADALSSGRTLGVILNDVLDFGNRDGSVPRKGRETSINLLQVARDAALVSSTQYMDPTGPASLSISYTDRDWSAIVDHAKFSRIVANALTNAMKFCKAGPISLMLEVTPDRQGMVITVQDAGIGFDEDKLSWLLEPFTKQDTHAPGAGLGLHITKMLVHDMGGSLELHSKAGEGTTFVATLPVRLLVHAANSSPDAPPETIIREVLKEASLPRSPHKPSGSGRHSPAALPVSRRPSGMLVSTPDPALRVLVVDDNDIIRNLLLKGLKKSPHPVVTSEARDGQQAVEVFTKFKPDLVLTDVSMPVMDGITAAGLMREELRTNGGRECHIYAITGLGSSDPRLKTLGMSGDAGFDGWLIKGKDGIDTIYGIVGRLCEARRTGVEPSGNANGVGRAGQRRG